MKKLLKEIARLWWIRAGIRLVNPRSNESVQALREVLSKDMEFENEVVEYLIGELTTKVKHGDQSDNSGIDVKDDESAVSAHFDRDDEDEENVDENSDPDFSLKEEVWVKNVKSGNVYPAKTFNPKNHIIATDAEKQKAQDDGNTEPSAEDEPSDGSGEEVPNDQPIEDPKADARAKADADIAQSAMTDFEKDAEEKKSKKDNKERVIAGKNKTLKKVDTLESETFTSELEPNDDEFRERNQKISNPTPPEPFVFPEIDTAKFPKKYMQALERMANTKPKGEGTKWQHFSDIPGGAGQISAQAGELMTMMGVSMDDGDFNKLTDSLLQHEKNLIKNNPELKKENTRIIGKSWIESAKNNREAILNRLSLEHPDVEVVATSWDTEDDVESLGLENYKDNKGFSSDMYVKLKKPDGQEILDEISLKKSTVVNFLNSTAGKFSDWDSSLPDNVNPTIYRDIERDNLAKTGEALSDNVEQLLNSPGGVDLKKLFDKKNVTFSDALTGLKKGKGSRAKSKVVLEAIKVLAKDGNEVAKKHLEDVQKHHREFQKNAIDAISNNPDMKKGMLEEIRNEFPLKSISDGEETMAIGKFSLDKKVMKDIFGTSDYDNIKEKLRAKPGPPPFVGYEVEAGGDVIPIAEIMVREDGVGYGGIIKFEMKLDKRFAKTLEKANKNVYKS